MSDRVDRKLEEIAVGHYAYRHEAEFAAGFLEDARIPYRLQIDDPGLGMPLSSSATIWVLGVDERRAREVLESEGSEADSRLPRSSAKPGSDALAPDPKADDRARPDSAADLAPAGSDAGGGPEAIDDFRAPATESASVFGRTPTSKVPGRARLLSLVASVGVASLMGVDAIARASVYAWALVMGVSVGLFVVAVLGRAPRSVRDILSTLSGDAP